MKSKGGQGFVKSWSCNEQVIMVAHTSARTSPPTVTNIFSNLGKPPISTFTVLFNTLFNGGGVGYHIFLHYQIVHKESQKFTSEKNGNPGTHF